MTVNGSRAGRARALVAIAVLLAANVVMTSQPARADRCEVSEPIVRVVDPRYEEPGDEASKPHCVVLDGVVYPLLGCDHIPLAQCLDNNLPFDTLYCVTIDFSGRQLCVGTDGLTEQ
jgi:hypothetical protein